jgi:hypothetical protein
VFQEVELSRSFMKLFTSCLLLIILVLSSVSAQKASKRSLVARLKNNAVADGCGCYFQYRGTPRNEQYYLFFSSIEDEEKTAWMNIEGQDVKLTLAKKMDPKGEVRVGSRSTRRYVADGTLVDATYVATKICKRDDESCESTDYSATFVVRKGAQVQTVKAVGGCGC